MPTDSQPQPTSEFSIPVLLYHSISEAPHDRMAVPPGLFREHLALLREEFCPIALKDALTMLAAGEPPPLRAVAVTFDDGYSDNYEVAVPLLSQYSVRATFFVCPNHLGQSNDWNPRAFIRRRHLAPQEVRAVQECGHEIGSHGLSHQYLPKLTHQEQRQEIIESRRRLIELCETDIRCFAYPYGDPDDHTLALVGDHYSLAFRTTRTSNANWHAAPFEIPRVPVSPFDYPDTLAEKLRARNSVPEPATSSLRDCDACAAMAIVADYASLLVVGEFNPQLPRALAKASRTGQRLWIHDSSPKPVWSDCTDARNSISEVAPRLSVAVCFDLPSLAVVLPKEPLFVWIGIPCQGAASGFVVAQCAALVASLQPGAMVGLWATREAVDGGELQAALRRRSASCLQLSPELLIAMIP